MDLAIEAADVGKTFGGVVALDGLNLSVRPGAIYGLVGRNGAGKTTALRLIMGLLKPDRGHTRVLGKDLRTASCEARARVAYVSQAHQLPRWMTTEELCYYVSHFYDHWDHAYARELASRLDTGWEQPVGLMSGGGQRKVAILLACAACPEVLILDEPAAGLDPVARRQLIEEIEAFIAQGRRCTVLFSTHIISDLERVAEYIGFVDGGRMAIETRLEDWQDSIKGVQVVFLKNRVPPADFVIPGALHSETSRSTVTAVVSLTHEDQLDDLRRQPDVTVNVFQLGLEESFIQLLGQTAQEAEAWHEPELEESKHEFNDKREKRE